MTPPRIRPVRAALLVATCSCLLLQSGSASAHVGHVILTAERYLKLDLGGNHARVVVSLTLGATEGQRVLALADTNGDGEVDPEESDSYLAAWAAGLAEEVPVTVDGQPVQPAWRDGFFDPPGRVRAVPLTIELVGHLDLEGGEQLVRVEDRMVRREVFERTDVSFQARDGAELIASGLEDEPTEVVLALSYGSDLRAGEPVPIVARVVTPERASTASDEDGWVGRLSLAALITGLAIALVFLSGRRRSR